MAILRLLCSWFALVALSSPALAIPAPTATATTTTTINQNTIVITPTDVIVNDFPLNAVASGLGMKSLDLAVAEVAIEDVASKQTTGVIDLPALISEFPVVYSSALDGMASAIVGGVIAGISEAGTTSSTSTAPSTSSTSSTSSRPPPPPPPPTTTASCNAPITSIAPGTTVTAAPAPTNSAIPSAIAQFCTPKKPVVLKQGEPYYLPSPYKFTPTHKYQAGFLLLSMTWSSDSKCDTMPNPPGITASVPTGPDFFCNKYMTEAVAACPATGTGATWETDCIIYGYEAYYGPTVHNA